MTNQINRLTGKDRSQRIQIDYYRRPTGLGRWRTICIGLGLLLGCGYAAYAMKIASPTTQISTGPIAGVHASFENDCNACHTDFTPINAEPSVGELANVGFFGSTDADQLGQKCQSCHNVGDHHRGVMKLDFQRIDENCADCHRDHQGRTHDLQRVANDVCLACHADLNDACRQPQPTRNRVAAFDTESHGQFASLQNGDPGTVKFDHAQHMLPGQVPAGSRNQFTLAMMSEAQRGRYRQPGQADDAIAQLSCDSCHQMGGNPDSNAAASPLIADHELGRYMHPIDFADHCAACHAISSGSDSEWSPEIPHVVAWKKVDFLLSANRRGQKNTGGLRSPWDDSQTVAKLGEGLGDAKTGGFPPDQAAAISIQRDSIRQQCTKCHHERALLDETISAALAGSLPPMIPPRWLTKGLYDHGAHRDVDCRSCHEQAYPDESDPNSGSGKPNDNDVVMIGGGETCTGCHRDPSLATPGDLVSEVPTHLFGGPATWASDECILCHRYHAPVSP